MMFELRGGLVPVLERQLDAAWTSSNPKFLSVASSVAPGLSACSSCSAQLTPISWAAIE